MKQLLYSFGNGPDAPVFLAVAVDTRAFLIHLASRQWLELGNPAPVGGSNITVSDNDPQPSRSDKEPGNDPVQSSLQIQAVAGCVVPTEANGETQIYCAVARQSKQLCIYRLNDWKVGSNNNSSTPLSPLSIIQPLTIHQAPKRVSSMVFASSLRPVPVLVTGDLAGDVFAYSLTHGSTQVTAKEAADEGQLRHRKLLLGHTASMLTGVAFCPNHNNDGETPRYILTADRDEKIRITRFPDTFDIHGFLFGHAAFVSCLVALDNGLCLSCGGDCTLRLWKTETCQLLGTFTLQKGDRPEVPCDMCVSEETGDGVGSIKVAVIYDRSTALDLFTVSVPRGDSDHVQFEKFQQVQLPGQPLGLSNTGPSFFILVQEPHLLQVYDWQGQKMTPPASVQQCNAFAVEHKARLPTAILERDHEDELKMVKNEETRGPAMLLPWNNADRKDVAFQKRKRQRKSRKSRKEAGGTNKEAPGEDEQEEDETGDAKVCSS